MRLLKAQIRGIGRLVDTSINLDSKVIAIVGPNEAGKTTLLKALSYIDDKDAFPSAFRSRAVEVADDTKTTELIYELDKEDQAELADLDLDELPTRMTVTRSASGGLGLTLQPYPKRAVVALAEAVDRLVAASEDDRFITWVGPETAYADPEDPAADPMRVLTRVINAVNAAIAKPGTGLADDHVKAAQGLSSAIIDTEDSSDFRGALGSILEWAERQNPEPSARKKLYDLSPDLILFGEAERSVQSAYLFNEDLVAGIPAALANLAALAGLDLAGLLALVQSGDNARRRTAIVQANARLDAIFKDAWKQSVLSVQFDLDGDQLRIELREDGDNITIFDERSAGLRMFIALIAFLGARNTGRPAILLIDEAENHLHIDAQADLVSMFMTQEYAVKVVYTTHSPACLPPDLGCGIRTVVPRPNNFQISDVRNSFWQGGSGFSPLMLAMGAAAAGFTPARYVVLAEGATEMILLPTLLRNACDLEDLRFQVAPGLSEVPKDFLPELDLEAARVAYLVNSDPGGIALRDALIEAQVPSRLIVEAGVPGIENVLDPSAYRSAIQALLPECNRTPPTPIPEVPQPAGAGSWAKQTSDWIKAQDLKPPSKVAVANWLVQNEKVILSEAGGVALAKIYTSLVSALRLD